MLTVVTDPTRPFRSARSQAQLTQLFDLVRRKSNGLFAFETVRAGFYIRGQRALGLQTVPLDSIIGSEGRYNDFDRHFLPRTDLVRQRWISIQQAMDRGVILPPIDLYKMSDVYFVRDGNHRVSVARHGGATEIDANVTELFVDVSLTPALSMSALLLKQERSDFLEWTNLRTLRPEERIECHELGGYLDLVRQINLHRTALSQAEGRPISRDEAVTDWYDNVYLPRMQCLQARAIV